MRTAWFVIKTERALLTALICFRLLNGLCLQSLFHPDEDWQAGEVAHFLVFDFGYLTWEWEKCIALRSVAHPAVFAVIFWMLKWVHLDFPWVIAIAPRLLQSFIAALTDYGVIHLAKEWYGNIAAADSAGDDLSSMIVFFDSPNNGQERIEPPEGVNDSEKASECDRSQIISNQSPSNSSPTRKQALSDSTTRHKKRGARNNGVGAEKGANCCSQSSARCISKAVATLLTGGPSSSADVQEGGRLVVCSIALCFLLSWFNFFTLPRTFSNCFETFWNVYALFFFALAHREEQKKARFGGPVDAQRIIVTGKSHEAKKGGEEEMHADVQMSSVGSEEDGDEKRWGPPGKISTEAAHQNKILTAFYGISLSETFPSLPTFYTFLALSSAALGVIMRPPAALFWAVFCLCKLLQLLCKSSVLSTEKNVKLGERIRSAAKFLRLCFIVGSITVGCNMYLDYLFYGKLTFPPLNFVRFNLAMDPGRFYGAHPWHYYIFECPIVVLLTFYPFFFLGVKFWLETIYRHSLHNYSIEAHRSGGEKRTIGEACEIARRFALHAISRDDGAALLATVCSLMGLSFATHKEYRFFISYMPVLLTYVGIGMTVYVSKYVRISTKCLAAQENSEQKADVGDPRYAKRNKGMLLVARGNPTTKKSTFLVVFGAQVVIAIYISFFHRRGSPSVLRFVRGLPDGSSVFFLTQAHELPYYAHVHRRIPMGFLDSSPRLRSEADFPENWERRLWTLEEKTDYYKFLDTFFTPPSSSQRICSSSSVSLPACSAVSRESHLSSTCPSPSPLAGLWSPTLRTSPVHTTSCNSISSSALSRLPSPAGSTYRAPCHESEEDSAGASASADHQACITSDIYTPVFKHSIVSFPVEYGIDVDQQEAKIIYGPSERRESEEGGQKLLGSNKQGGVAGKTSSPADSTSEDTFWFGNAVQFRKQLCRTARWPHSENCEVTPDFADCLDYRFLVPLHGKLPTHFVVMSSLYEKLSEWFISRGYSVVYGPVFDSIVGESPRGKVFWQSIYILGRPP